MSLLYKCAFCKEGIDGLTLLVKTNCEHILHLSCMGELWISCPECNSAISRSELESAQEMLKSEEDVKLKNSCDQETRLINCEKSVERITSKLQNRINECEKNIKALIKVKSQQKINDLENRLDIFEANTVSQQKEKVQYESSNEYANKVQNLLKEFEKKVELINVYNAQQHNEKVQFELNNKNWLKLQNRLNECEKKVESLKQSNAQLKINSKQTYDLQKCQDGCGKNAETLKKINAQLEVGTKNMSRLQNRLHLCEKNFDVLKKVNAKLELGAKQTHNFQNRLDRIEKAVENTIQLKTEFKNFNQNTLDLQDRVQNIEKMIMELQHKFNQSLEFKTVSLAPTTAKEMLEIEIADACKEIENMQHELKMSLAQPSFNDTQNFDCDTENAMVEKNTKIKEKLKQLKVRVLRREQEKEGDLLHNDSNAGVTIAEQKGISPDEPKIQKKKNDDNDYEKVTFAATADDNYAETQNSTSEI